MATYESNYAKTVQWRKDHPDVIRGYNARYYAANSERLKQRRKENYQLQRQQYLERQKNKREQDELAKQSITTNNEEPIVTLESTVIPDEGSKKIDTVQDIISLTGDKHDNILTSNDLKN
jgi:uncharacterized protein RhaS with RHS repeats